MLRHAIGAEIEDRLFTVGSDGLQPVAIDAESLPDFSDIRHPGDKQGGIQLAGRHIRLLKQKPDVVTVLGINPHQLRKDKIRCGWSVQPQPGKIEFVQHHRLLKPVRRENDLSVLEQMREIQSGVTEFPVHPILGQPKVFIGFQRPEIPGRQNGVNIHRRMKIRGGIGKPERLKFQLAGCWSRRITKEHRLVYQIEKDGIIVISCRYHYE